MTLASLHKPVMLPEVLEALNLSDEKVVVDATFGRGGYTQAILDRGARVIAFDRDPEAVAVGQKMAEKNPRLTVVHAPFGDMAAHLSALGVQEVDGVVFDLGVSSPQLDEAERGFSFRADGPLDMRMDPTTGETAADLVNHYAEQDLADLIWHYGDERFSRRIARAIVENRPFSRTSELASVVRSVVPKNPKDTIDQATRTFQALRIAVNDELGELERGLEGAAQVLQHGGRLVVVSFHSLEDRIAKTFIRKMSGGDSAPSRHLPVVAQAQKTASFKTVGKQPVAARAEESSENPRARSAKLRVAEKIGVQGDAPSQAQGGGL